MNTKYNLYNLDEILETVGLTVSQSLDQLEDAELMWFFFYVSSGNPTNSAIANVNIRTITKPLFDNDVITPLTKNAINTYMSKRI
jgi:hypothetical protein